MINIKSILLSTVVVHSGISLAAEDIRGNRGIDLGIKGSQRITQERPTTIVLPPLDQVLPKGLGVWAQPTVAVTEIRLEGNTVLAMSEVQALTQKYIGESMSSRDIQSLREALSKVYLDKGYVNSGVTIPDQDLAGGVLALQAVEGTLTSIVIKDNGRLDAGYVSSRIAHRVGSPLNINALQEAIQLLQQDEHIDQLAAELAPGTQRGEAQLRVTVKEEAKWQMGVVVDNHRSESIGAEQANFMLRHNNVSGSGDTIDLNIGASQGNNNYSLNYSLPVFPNDAALSVYASSGDAVVLEEPFDQLDVKSDNLTVGMAFSWPLIKNLSQDLAISTAIEAKRSTTELLGRAFSLSPGAINGESKDTVVSLSLDWARRSEAQVIAFRSTVRKGVDLGNVTLFKNNPLGSVDADGEFMTWVNQAQFVRKLNDRSRLKIRVLSQIAFDPLLSLEKLAIGGANTVRGYRENFLVRDNGLSINLEVPYDFPLGEQSTIQLMPFFDYGRSWDDKDTDTTSKVRNTDDSRYIASLGLGLSYRHNNGVSANLTWAKDITDNFEAGENPQDRVIDKGLQDHGIHFSVGYMKRF